MVNKLFLALLVLGAGYYFGQNEAQYLFKRVVRLLFKDANSVAPSQPPTGDWRIERIEEFRAFTQEYPGKTNIRIMRNGGENSAQTIEVDAGRYSDFERLCQDSAISLGMGEERRYYMTTYSGIHVQNFGVLAEFLRKSVFDYVMVPDKDWFVWPPIKVGHQAVQIKEGCTDSFGNQIVIETLALSPKVFRIANFIRDDEIKAIMDFAVDLKRSEVFEGEGRNEQQEVRTSSQLWIPYGRLSQSDLISERIAACLGMIPDSLAEDLQVLRYEIGQHYHAHMDFFDPRYINPVPESVQRGRNRFLTVLFYLTDVEEGGETVFPRADEAEQLWDYNYSSCEKGLLVKPKRAQVAMFYDLTTEGQQNAQPGVLDERSLHGACDVKVGVKWAANKWYYNKH